MRLLHIVGLLVLLSASLACSGCTSPQAVSRDTLFDESGAGDSVLFSPDAMSAKIKESTKALVGKGYSPDKARERYAEATNQYLQAMRTQDDERIDLLLSAADDFTNAAERWPDSALEQDALFMAGESYFFADRYPKANDVYEELLKKYPNSKYLDMVDARRFSTAQYWLDMHKESPQSFWSFNFFDKKRPMRDSFGHAVRIYDRIRIDDPTGKLADDATLAAGNAYFASANYLDADNFYTDLRKTFPSSEHQFRAHLLGLKAKLLTYEGPDYSGDPLDDAEKLTKQIRRQFPREASQEREYLARAYAEVRYKKAEREWNMAKYYDRRGEYGAARYHYSLLDRDYDSTPLAERARGRLAEIAGEPDVPPQRLAWVVDMFPEEDDVKPMIATAPGVTRR